MIDVGRYGKTGKRIRLCSVCLLRVRMQFSMTLVPSYLAKYLEINKNLQRFKILKSPKILQVAQVFACLLSN